MQCLCRVKKFSMSSGPDAEDYLEGDLSQVSQSPFLKNNVMRWALFKLAVRLRTSRASKNGDYLSVVFFWLSKLFFEDIEFL